MLAPVQAKLVRLVLAAGRGRVGDGRDLGCAGLANSQWRWHETQDEDRRRQDGQDLAGTAEGIGR